MESPATSASSVGDSSFGRTKENVPADSTLRETAMSASSLSAMSFELPPSFLVSTKDILKNAEVPDAMYASSGSSTCTRESDTYASDADTALPRLDRGASDKLNAKVSMRKTSRQGRSTQRWITESTDEMPIRLVTGCIPILKGGKIMFVSASRKPEWIFPKGGWETDETMEEAAVRESFEEAGVLGVLGPKLKEIQYETRKSKKRRLEHEESTRKTKAKVEGNETPPSATVVPSVDSTKKVVVADESMARIMAQEAKTPPLSADQSSGQASVSSAAAQYSQVRMTLFPLYISKVLEKWPEDGRFRKAVDIDEAIKLLETRPELQQVLMDLKDKGLHLSSGHSSI